VVRWLYFTRDHRYPAAGKFSEYGLCIFVKARRRALDCFLKRMPDQLSSLVMFNPDCVRPFLAAIVCPTQIAGEYVFRSL